LFAASYVAIRLFAPFVVAAPSYPDFNGPALARFAQRQWSEVGGPIPYIVSLGEQRSRQAAGSILFDSSIRAPVFDNADPRAAPWIDVGDLARRGALVVSMVPLKPDRRVAGRPIEHIVAFEWPTLRKRFRMPRIVYFAIIRPANRP
jgi:hypothetical protein